VGELGDAADRFAAATDRLAAAVERVQAIGVPESGASPRT